MIAKTFIILGIVAAALVICLRLAGVIPEDIMNDSLGRSLGILAVLAVAGGAIGLIIGRGPKINSKNESPPNAGPKF